MDRGRKYVSQFLFSSSKNKIFTGRAICSTVFLGTNAYFKKYAQTPMIIIAITFINYALYILVWLYWRFCFVLFFFPTGSSQTYQNPFDFVFKHKRFLKTKIILKISYSCFSYLHFGARENIKNLHNHKIPHLQVCEHVEALRGQTDTKSHTPPLFIPVISVMEVLERNKIVC